MATRRLKRPRDPVELGKLIGDILTGQVEDAAPRSITRLTDISRTTPIKLLEDAGAAFSACQDKALVNLPCRRVQVDEAWAYAKKNVAKAAPVGAGDIRIEVGLGADTKPVASRYVGGRDSEAAMEFMGDLAPRPAQRVRLTSDGRKPYLEAIEGAFGGDIDCAMLIKHYGPAPEQSAARRYSPAECTGISVKRLRVIPPLFSRHPGAAGCGQRGGLGALRPSRHADPRHDGRRAARPRRPTRLNFSYELCNYPLHALDSCGHGTLENVDAAFRANRHEHAG